MSIFLVFILIAVLIPIILIAMVAGEGNPFALVFKKLNTCRVMKAKYFSGIIVISVILKSIYSQESGSEFLVLALVSLIPLYVGSMFLQGKTIQLQYAILEPNSHILRVLSFGLSILFFIFIIST